MKATKTPLSDHCRKRLREWFDASGMTQLQVANRMGWKEQTSVSGYFNGKQDLSLDQAAEMAAVLGHDIVQLVTMQSTKTTKQDAEELEWLMSLRRIDDSVLRESLLALAASSGVRRRSSGQVRARK